MPKEMDKLATLPDPAIFGKDDKKIDELAIELSFMNEQGIAIATPRVVDLSAQHELPLLWFSRRSDRRQWDVRAQSNTFVVLSDLRGRGANIFDLRRSGKMRDLRRERRSRTGQMPDEHSNDKSSGIQRFNLRDIADLPWEASAYAVTGLSFDWRTATRVSELRLDAKPPTGGLFAAPSSSSMPHPLYDNEVRETMMRSRVVVSGVQGAAPSSAETLHLQLPSKIAQHEPFELAMRFPVRWQVLSEAEPLAVTLFFLRRDDREPPKLTLFFPSDLHERASESGSAEIKVLHRVESFADKLHPGDYMVVAAFGTLVGGPAPLMVQ